VNPESDFPMAVSPGVSAATECRPQAQLGLGCVSLGRNRRNGVRLVRQALDVGLRFFDTADAYGRGESERILGRGLRQRRDQAFIATKAGYTFKERSVLVSGARPLLRAARDKARPAHLTGPRMANFGSASTVSYGAQDFSPAHLRKALEASLRRLETDFVDLYQLHGPREVHDDVVALMTDLRAAGKIRGFGVGLETLEHAMGWLDNGQLSAIQVPFGLLDPQAGDHVIPRAEAIHLPVIVRGVFAGGFVARPPGDDLGQLRPGQPERLAALGDLASSLGVSTMQLAVWFAAARPGVSMVLVGTSSPAHLCQVAQCFQTAPPDDVLQRLDRVLEETAEV
jgi:aryl-alcohol dehydrogenase-like predicted oxidoreductase